MVTPRAIRKGRRLMPGLAFLLWSMGSSGCGAVDEAMPASDEVDVTPEANAPSIDGPEQFGFGTRATHAQIDAWDTDVMADGSGLPAGEGTAETGAAVFAQHCASCHGHDGEGGTGGVLVLAEPGPAPPFGPRYEEWRGDKEDVPFAVGNYWPYATTLFDYIRRAMPSSAPGSLEANQVYGLVAWLLVQNTIIPEDLVMNAETLPRVEMPARDIFVPDDRQGGAEVR